MTLVHGSGGGGAQLRPGRGGSLAAASEAAGAGPAATVAGARRGAHPIGRALAGADATAIATAATAIAAAATTHTATSITSNATNINNNINDRSAVAANESGGEPGGAGNDNKADNNHNPDRYHQRQAGARRDYANNDGGRSMSAAAWAHYKRNVNGKLNADAQAGARAPALRERQVEVARPGDWNGASERQEGGAKAEAEAEVGAEVELEVEEEAEVERERERERGEEKSEPAKVAGAGRDRCGVAGRGNAADDHDHHHDRHREMSSGWPRALATGRPARAKPPSPPSSPGGQPGAGHLANKLVSVVRLPADAGLSPTKYGACQLASSASSLGINSSASSASAFANSTCSFVNVGSFSAGHSDGDPARKKEKRAETHESGLSLLERLAARVPCLGIIFALCASVFLGSAGMLVKMIQSVHGIQVAIFRAFIQFALYLLVIHLRGLPSYLPERRELKPVMGRALLGSVSITFSYCALRMIPLGDATTIRFSLPIWTLIIGYIVLNESCSFYKVFAVWLSISGVILIAKPDDCVYLFTRLAVGLNLMDECGLAASSGELTSASTLHRAAFGHALGGRAPLVGAPSAPSADFLAAGLAPELALGPTMKGLAYDDANDATGPPLVRSEWQQRDASRPLFSLAPSQAGRAPTTPPAPQDTAAQASPGEPGRPGITPANATTSDEHRAPHAQARQFEGCLLALSSSISLSLSLIALRLCRRTPAEITILWLSIFSMLIGSATLLVIGQWRLPDNWLDVAFIILNGACGSIGQWFITSALKIEQSGVISLARTFDIEVAFLYSAFVLHEQIRMTSIVGSLLVSCGVVAVLVPKWLQGRQETSA